MKNIYKHWKTTAIGILSIILITLSNTGIYTPGEIDMLGEMSKQIITHIDGILVAVLSIVLMWSKDGDKNDSD